MASTAALDAERAAAEILAEKFTSIPLPVETKEEPEETAASPAPPTEESTVAPPQDLSNVQAYAKLDGPDLDYFVTKLKIVLGRKPAQAESDIDVDLGVSKAISREHARIDYNFVSGFFELVVTGKNGAFVNNRFVGVGEVGVPLKHGAQIKIGDRQFKFLLPHGGSDGSMASPPEDEDGMRPRKHRVDDDNEKGNKRQRISHTPQSDDGEGEPRPNLSYATMIFQAITSCPSRKMTLNGIYTWICENYPYYRMVKVGWQNSIRHNLSLNKAFKKVPREEPGKGGWWTVDTDYEIIPSTSRRRTPQSTLVLQQQLQPNPQPPQSQVQLKVAPSDASPPVPHQQLPPPPPSHIAARPVEKTAMVE